MPVLKINKEEPVLSISEADTPASFPSHHPAPKLHHNTLALRHELNKPPQVLNAAC